MHRILGTTFGVLTHALFGVVVWQLFWFLKGPDVPAGHSGELWLDALLAIQFAVPHSVLLLPSVRARLSSIVPDAFYGCFFCVVTSLSLLLLLANWQSSAVVIWQASGTVRFIVQAAFFASWAALFYSLSLTGLGYQTGWTPWWHWLRRKALGPRTFKPRSAYLLLRHPVYLSFLGLIWFVPVMTLDRAVLTGIWTVYIFFGSWLKDRRLVYYLGERYRQYQSVVSGYPGMLIGPLGRVAINEI